MARGIDPKDPTRSIQEEVQFGRPRIIFRRIKGRIVPIQVKRELGKDLVDIGTSIVKGAGAVGGAVVAAKFLQKKTKKARVGFSQSSFGKITSFGFKRLSKLAKDNQIPKIAKKKGVVGRAAGKVAGFAIRNPGKLAIAAGIIGVATTALGANVQAETKFGFRIPRK